MRSVNLLGGGDIFLPSPIIRIFALSQIRISGVDKIPRMGNFPSAPYKWVFALAGIHLFGMDRFPKIRPTLIRPENLLI